MKIGKYEIKEILTPFFALDGGAMFGIVPKTLWKKSIEPDDQNRIPMGARCLLLISEDEKILIDTGIGSNWDEKFIKNYDVKFSNTLIDSLENANIRKSDISKVILTHLHFDHTGGSVEYNDGKYQPTFPNAEYIIQLEQYEWALNPTIKDKASYIPERYKTLHQFDQLVFLKGNYEINENIKLECFDGHTKSQQLVVIEDTSNKVMFMGDLFPTSHHIHIPYIMSYDNFPLITAKEKEKVLKKAVDENMFLIFEHDRNTAMATVKLIEKGYALDKTYEYL